MTAETALLRPIPRTPEVDGLQAYGGIVTVLGRVPRVFPDITPDMLATLGGPETLWNAGEQVHHVDRRRTYELVLTRRPEEEEIQGGRIADRTGLVRLGLDARMYDLDEGILTPGRHVSLDARLRLDQGRVASYGLGRAVVFDGKRHFVGPDALAAIPQMLPDMYSMQPPRGRGRS